MAPRQQIPATAEPAEESRQCESVHRAHAGLPLSPTMCAGDMNGCVPRSTPGMQLRVYMPKVQMRKCPKRRQHCQRQPERKANQIDGNHGLTLFPAAVLSRVPRSEDLL